MGLDRSIVYSHECSTAADRLGGWRQLDAVLEPILDGLRRNPYGYPKYECDWCSVRYVVTKATGRLPSLAWYFTINKQNVEFVDVEEYEAY